jgi:Flp pilus assembly pilin Flp
MMRTLKQLRADEHGFVISAELVLVMTIAVLAMVVGLHAVAKSITMELNDVANAFGAVSQSYMYKGLKKPRHAAVNGSAFRDGRDACDCTAIIQPKPNVKQDPSGRRPEAGRRH